MGSTDHYGLQKLGANESFALNGYKFTDADRDTIDQKLYLGAEGHHHTGNDGTGETPTLGPSLSLSTTGGTIPAGTRVAYKIGYVNSIGEESAASPESYVDTPAAIAIPGNPTLTTATTGGVLNPGNYYYVLSAYTMASTVETRALNTAYITIPAVTATNTNTVTFPTVPAGATGFNIYRRAPGQSKYFHLATVPTNVATPPTYYLDDGSVSEDCDRTLPTVNSTNSTNSITIAIPGATPTVPAGYTWKVYRTYTIGNYSSQSLLQHVVETVTEESLVVVPSITDVGQALNAGSPRTATGYSASPSKILLTDGAEVQGILPASAISYQHEVQFTFAGTLTAQTGKFIWMCEFEAARILHCRASLGVGSTPASQSVIVDVNKFAGATPTTSTIYTTQGNRPRVTVGQTIGSVTVPDVDDIVYGEGLTVDIDQAGGGATPTDANLSVTILLHVYSTDDTSFTP